MNIFDIIKRPLITEKATANKAKWNEYTFAVNTRANKHQIREAVETLFGVKVDNVWTSQQKGKPKRMGKRMGHTPDWKKAIVRLKDKETIKILEG